MQKQPIPSKDVDAYLAAFPEAARQKLDALRKVIRRMSPEAEETIKYGIPTYVLNRKNLVHFGGFARHVGFYPTPGAIAKFRNELGGYATSKGAVKFPLERPLPLDLIERIIRYRVEAVG